MFFSLRASRHHLPAGVAVVTQFHAWWHILTGLGSHLHILLRWTTPTHKGPSQPTDWALVCSFVPGSKLLLYSSLQIRSIYLKHRARVKVCWSTAHMACWGDEFTDSSLLSLSLYVESGPYCMLNHRRKVEIRISWRRWLPVFNLVWKPCFLNGSNKITSLLY